MRRSLTVKVMAVDCPSSVRRFGDYYCDGVSDEVEINAAIESLGSVGGVVELSPGTFTVSSPVLIREWVVLRGVGPNTVIKSSSTNVEPLLRYGGSIGETGVASGGSSTTLVDGAKQWSENQFTYRWVVILRGTGAGQRRRIVSNTSNTLVVDTPWGTVPDGTSVYLVGVSSISTVSVEGIRFVAMGSYVSRPVYSCGPDWVRCSAVSWSTNEHVGKLVVVYLGSGAGQVSRVISNTSDTVYLEHPLYVLPAQGDRVFIGQGCVYMPDNHADRLRITRCMFYGQVGGVVVGVLGRVHVSECWFHAGLGNGLVLYPRISFPRSEEQLWSSCSARVEGVYWWVGECCGVACYLPRVVITGCRFQVNQRPGIGVYVESGKGHLISGNMFQSYDTTVAADTGSVASATSTTLTASGKSWSANAYRDMSVLITAGAGSGQMRRIVSNTSNTLTVSQAWGVVPDASSQYMIWDKGLGGVVINSGQAVVSGNHFYLGGGYQGLARGVLNLGGSSVLVSGNSVERWDSYDAPLLEDVAGTAVSSNNIGV